MSQFCEHFLAPLARRHVRLGLLQWDSSDGIPLELAVALLGGRTRLQAHSLHRRIRGLARSQPSPRFWGTPALRGRYLDSVAMEVGSLTLVLPTYNEEERLGSALDELFGCLGRRGERARDGSPGSAFRPADIRVLVVDDGSVDRTVESVRARPEFGRLAGPGGSLALLEVQQGGKGAAVRAGMLAADGDLVAVTDADMATWTRRSAWRPISKTRH